MAINIYYHILVQCHAISGKLDDIKYAADENVMCVF